MKVANDYYRIKVNNRHPLSREDFVGKALEGLWEVSNEWDYKEGASFSTYSAKALRSSYLEPMRLNNTRKVASANAQRRAESQESSQDAVYTEEDTFLKRHTVDKLQAPRGENRTLLDTLEKPESIDHGDLVDTVESFREFVYDIVDSPNPKRDAAVYLESLTGSPGRGGYIKPRSPPNVRLAEKHDLSSERIRQIKEYVSDRVKAERGKFIDSQRGKPL